MMNIIGIVIDVFLLAILTLDYLMFRTYKSEIDDLRHKLWKLEHEISEIYDYQRIKGHG